MKQEKQTQGIAAAQVFIGGACYGANATLFKTAFAQGFSWPQVVACQMWFGAALFALAVVVRRTQGNRWEKLGTKTLLKLAGLRCLTCTTSILYCFAMSRLPVAVAITLLFQFTWIGLVIQVIATRRPPRLGKVAAALVRFLRVRCLQAACIGRALPATTRLALLTAFIERACTSRPTKVVVFNMKEPLSMLVAWPPPVRIRHSPLSA